MVSPQKFPSEFQWNTKLGCQLIRTHALRGSLHEALKVFNCLHDQNVYAWTAIISAYVQRDQNEQAVLLYNQMQTTGVEPSSYTIVAVLKACANLATLDEGKLIHSEIMQQGLKSDLFVKNTLVDMYAKCGSIEDAWAVFVELPVRDVMSWSAIIAGYIQHGHGCRAL